MASSPDTTVESIQTDEDRFEMPPMLNVFQVEPAESEEKGNSADNDNFDDDASLSWRLDRADSLSDWTIIVKIEDTDEVAMYHTHKNILAVGSRKSDYFSKLFRSELQMKENRTCTSILTLKRSAAEVFPRFLDFVYKVTSEFEMSALHAVALRYLARFLGVKRMLTTVSKFIQNNWIIENAVTYLRESYVYDDEKLLSAALTLCAERIIDLDLDEVATLPGSLFERVVNSPDLHCESKELSEIVAAYCERNTVEEDLLLRLTSEDFMPEISPEAAIVFIRLNTREWDVGEQSSNKKASLLDRCKKACSFSWLDVLAKPQRKSKNHRDLPTEIQITLLESAMSSARDTVMGLQNEVLALKKENEKQRTENLLLSNSVKSLTAENSRLNSEISRMSAEKDTILVRMNTRIKKYESEIGLLNKRMRRQEISPSRREKPPSNEKQAPNQMRSPEENNNVISGSRGSLVWTQLM